jgi:DNA-binding MarR family transcriptional regulator
MRYANLVQLAEEMGVTMSTTSRLVDRLVTADWVHRQPAEHDRREVSLTLTDQGADLLTRYDDGRVARLRESVERVPPGRRDDVVAALTELARVARP